LNPPGTPEQRVFLHVGAPKTGTTFLQSVLFHHRDRLRELGVLYPADEYDDHFFAAVDLQDLDFSGQPRPEATGRWEEVAARVRAWPGTSVISHDVLAGATPEQAQRAIDSLAPATVHVVVTARDLSLQVPSHWQEDVKHGQRADFDDWYTRVAAHDDQEWQLRWFWRVEDIPDVLARWGSTLPPTQVHVVTVPRPGGPTDVLWRRFAGVLGLDSCDVDLGVVRHANTGLGRAEVELIRRLNTGPAQALPAPTYERVVKGILAHEVLARSHGSARLVLPDRLVAEVTDLATGWAGQLAVAGYDVVGDLDELVPEPRSPGAVAATPPTTEDVLAAATGAVYVLVTRLAETRERLGREERLRAERDDLREQLRAARAVIDEHANLPAWVRIKRTVVEIARRNRAVGVLYRGYRWARRRR
jgi:hypothetical protein